MDAKPQELAGFSTCGADRGGRSIYFWNESDHEFGYAPQPNPNPSDSGAIPLGKVTIGCGWMPEGWTLAVLDAPATPTSTGNAIAEVRGGDFPGRVAEVWIHVTKDGHVQTGGGVPGWWQQDRQRCGGLSRGPARVTLA